MNLNIFKENYTGPIFLKRVFSHMNAVSRCLNNTRGISGVRVEPNEFGGLDIAADSAAASVRCMWRLGAFGSGAPTVVIGVGFVVAGVQTPIMLGESLVTVSGGTLLSPSFAFVEYFYGAHSAVVATTTTAQYPVSEPTVYRQVLHSFALVGGVPTHVRQHTLGDVIVPGWS